MKKNMRLRKTKQMPAAPVESTPVSPETLVFQMLDQGDVFTYAMDRDLRYLFLNRKVREEAFHGLSLEEVLGRTGRDFFPDGADSNDLDDLEYHDRYVLHTRKSIQVYETLMGRILYSTKWPLYDANDEVCGIAGVSFDVTDVVAERVRGEGDDAELLVNMMNSTSRMTRALMRIQNSI